MIERLLPLVARALRQRPLWLVVVGLLVALLMGAPPVWCSVDERASALVMDIEGDAAVDRPGSTTSIQVYVGMQLFAGDRLVASAVDSKVSLFYENGGLMSVELPAGSKPRPVGDKAVNPESNTGVVASLREGIKGLFGSRAQVQKSEIGAVEAGYIFARVQEPGAPSRADESGDELSDPTPSQAAPGGRTEAEDGADVATSSRPTSRSPARAPAPVGGNAPPVVPFGKDNTLVKEGMAPEIDSAPVPQSPAAAPPGRPQERTVLVQDSIEKLRRNRAKLEPRSSESSLSESLEKTAFDRDGDLREMQVASVAGPIPKLARLPKGTFSFTRKVFADDKPSAEILLDQSAPLVAGKSYTVEVSAPGHSPWTLRVSMPTPATLTALRARLEQLPGAQHVQNLLRARLLEDERLYFWALREYVDYINVVDAAVHESGTPERKAQVKRLAWLYRQIAVLSIRVGDAVNLNRAREALAEIGIGLGRVPVKR